jgi:hypothetical protein
MQILGYADVLRRPSYMIRKVAHMGKRRFGGMIWGGRRLKKAVETAEFA